MPERFEGKSILLLEDEPFIAIVFEEALQEVGATVTTTRTIKEAKVALSNLPIDAAALDYLVGGQTSEPVAEILLQKHIPFVITSGFPPNGINQWSVPWPVKPFLPKDLLDALAEAAKM
jgi:CheY-like chemotaxis protein